MFGTTLSSVAYSMYVPSDLEMMREAAAGIDPSLFENV
jgi:hypothetical protein